MNSNTIKQRLEYLRGELRAERIATNELLELQNLAEHIEPGDVELLEAAGVPETKTPETKTRIFFVADSEESNEEIFETLEEAQAHKISVLGTERGARVYIAMIRNAYKEMDGSWNYEDLSDTFSFIKEV